MLIQTELVCERIAKGLPSSEPMAVIYSDDHPNHLPVMTIATGWSERKQTFHTHTVYTVEEFPCQGEFHGRGFRLAKLLESKGHQQPMQVADSEPINCFVDRDEQHHICDCAGHSYKGYCKHIDALKWLMSHDMIEDPHAGSAVVDGIEDPFQGVEL